MPESFSIAEDKDRIVGILAERAGAIVVQYLEGTQAKRGDTRALYKVCMQAVLEMAAELEQSITQALSAHDLWDADARQLHSQQVMTQLDAIAGGALILSLFYSAPAKGFLLESGPLGTTKPR